MSIFPFIVMNMYFYYKKKSSLPESDRTAGAALRSGSRHLNDVFETTKNRFCYNKTLFPRLAFSLVLVKDKTKFRYFWSGTEANKETSIVQSKWKCSKTNWHRLIAKRYTRFIALLIFRCTLSVLCNMEYNNYNYFVALSTLYDQNN